ncbi:MAG: glucose-6-phosphate dehydrogenase [Candidatus Magasanikbacteria bacterium]|nr:glucose-6-phosphate dehydrogenase [Candidatus Magasanikbacteria bacterium]
MNSNNIPTILVVLGATGDLMRKKIVPALWHLFGEQQLPERFRVIGLARREWSEAEFRREIKKIIAEHQAAHPSPSRADEKKFLSLFTYHAGEFADPRTFPALAKQLSQTDAAWGVCANKIFYLATPPQHYAIIFRRLARVKLNLPCSAETGWTRVLAEKPFGASGRDAEQLEKLLAKYFREEQLYLIDHYLAKEIIEGILNFRFSNNLLECAWDNRTIERIDLRLLETIGVEERGAFYDPVGALRDVGQNHLLSVLALLTMDTPAAMNARQIRHQRAAILQTLNPWTAPALKTNSDRAQYSGYQQIAGVRPRSATETYFKLTTALNHPRWQGVPITLEAGKRCREMRKEAVVTFRHPPVCLDCRPGAHFQNQIIFSLEPDDSIRIRFWTKKPGYQRELEERAFTFFLYEKRQPAQYVEEYAKLLRDCIRGDQMRFVSWGEVAAAWRLVDPVITAWQKNLVPLHHYKPGVTPLPASPPTPKKVIQPRSLGIIGLGKMGSGLARRLLERGWPVVGYNRTPEATQLLAPDGLRPAESIKDLVKKLSPPAAPSRPEEPRLVWLMVPAGAAVDEVLFGKNGLTNYLKRGDIVIDGGNSFYQDAGRRAKRLARWGIKFMDVGVSGGPHGARTGSSLMIGGDAKLFAYLEPLWRDLSAAGGYQFFPGVGAGHFVKMVHNGIEYGMMQAIAEGFDILHRARFRLDLSRVADVYNHGSVIESRLLGWLRNALQIHGPKLARVSARVGHTGEGDWTVATAHALKVRDRVIHDAVRFRQRSQTHPEFAGKILSALREQFGGHAV